jgi:sulfonate transport system permease protein
MTTSIPSSDLTRRLASVRDPAEGVRLPARRNTRRPFRYRLAIGPVLLVALWSLASATGWLDPKVLSAPWTVVATARDLIASGRLGEDLRMSGQRAILGFVLGLTAGTLLALVAGLTRTGEALIDGTVQVKRAIPTVALIPMLILWFGIGEPMKVITIGLTVFFPVYLHTHAALRSIDVRYVELARTVGLSRWQFIRRVALPGSLPGFLLGVRLAVTSAWLALVVVEQVNATSGIGYMIFLARSYGQTEIIVVGLVIYGLLGLASDTLVRVVERRLLSWRRVLDA